MAVGVSQTSSYVEGADKVSRLAITGDNAYPTGGYDILTAYRSLAGNGGKLIKRIISWRHKTLASKLVGDAVFVDTYSGGSLSALTMPIVVAAGTQLANGSDASNINVELIVEGY